MQDDLELTTREQIADMQARRLPSLVRRMALVLHPEIELERSILEDALELAAADVVESGRDFEALTNEERQTVLDTYLGYCRQRNTRYLLAVEGLENQN